MGIASFALLAASAVPAAGVPVAPLKAPVAEQVQVTRPPRAATELVAQPAEVKPGEPAAPAGDPAGTVVVQPARADPAPPSAGSAPAGPAPSPGQGGAAVPSAPAQDAAFPPAASPPPGSPQPSPQPAPVADSPSAAPGFSTDLVSPAPPASTGPAIDPDRAVDRSPPAWPWAALGLVLLAAASAAYRTLRRRLAGRTRSMLSLQPRLDRSSMAQSPPRLAFAGPSTAIATRLEPGAARTWTQ